MVSAFLELLACGERELRYGGGRSFAHTGTLAAIPCAAIYGSEVRPVRGQSVRAVLQALSYQAARPYSLVLTRSSVVTDATRVTMARATTNKMPFDAQSWIKPPRAIAITRSTNPDFKEISKWAGVSNSRFRCRQGLGYHLWLEAQRPCMADHQGWLKLDTILRNNKQCASLKTVLACFDSGDRLLLLGVWNIGLRRRRPRRSDPYLGKHNGKSNSASDRFQITGDRTLGHR